MLAGVLADQQFFFKWPIWETSIVVTAAAHKQCACQGWVRHELKDLLAGLLLPFFPIRRLAQTGHAGISNTIFAVKPIHPPGVHPIQHERTNREADRPPALAAVF